MSDKSKIIWTDTTWNPVTGCSKVSPWCRLCYAEKMTARLQKMGQSKYAAGFDTVVAHPETFDAPLSWGKPRLVFVNSMSDLFHRDVSDEVLAEVWATMVKADWHHFQVLTKRPHRMARKIETLGLDTPAHIWLGTSVENQKFAESRIPALLSISGESLRWISAEPLLGPLDLMDWLPRFMTNVAMTFTDRGGVERHDLDGAPVHPLEWVVAGGESGLWRDADGSGLGAANP